MAALLSFEQGRGQDEPARLIEELGAWLHRSWREKNPAALAVSPPSSALKTSIIQRRDRRPPLRLRSPRPPGRVRHDQPQQQSAARRLPLRLPGPPRRPDRPQPVGRRRQGQPDRLGRPGAHRRAVGPGPLRAHGRRARRGGGLAERSVHAGGRRGPLGGPRLLRHEGLPGRGRESGRGDRPGPPARAARPGLHLRRGGRHPRRAAPDRDLRAGRRPAAERDHRRAHVAAGGAGPQGAPEAADRAGAAAAPTAATRTWGSTPSSPPAGSSWP